jgi:hypothetical protein
LSETKFTLIYLKSNPGLRDERPENNGLFKDEEKEREKRRV